MIKVRIVLVVIRRAPLHWWSVEKFSSWIVEKGPLTMMASVEEPAYIGGQWKSAHLHWWSVQEGPFTLVVSVVPSTMVVTVEVPSLT